MLRHVFQFGRNVTIFQVRFRSSQRGPKECESIGFIGLGNMGSYMSKNLIKKGFKVTVYDVNEKSSEPLMKFGANVATSSKELVSSVDCVITMLPASAHLISLYKGENGIISHIKPGTLVIDCSTIDPSTSQSIEPDFKDVKADFIDAPVSGGVLAAENGTLTFMVGGDQTPVQKANSILLAMGTKVIHCGPIGSGQIAKMCNNLLLGISMLGVSEAMNLGTKLGLDPKLLASVINSSSGRCWSSDTYNPVPGVIKGVPSSREYQPGFTAQMITKDLKIAEKAAAISGIPLDMGRKTLDIYSEICNQMGDKDFSVAYKYFKDK